MIANVTRYDHKLNVPRLQSWHVKFFISTRDNFQLSISDCQFYFVPLQQYLL